MVAECREAVFTPLRLSRLADDLGNDEAAINYAAMFLELLPARTERLLSAVRAGSTVERLDTVLSLKVSSHMVGGVALEDSCRALEEHVSGGDHSSAVIAAQRIARESTALQLALEKYLRKQRG
ncbi:hypothetical protein [Arthrobacter sp. OAP107]|uniref:hypothetical protein n=1 Tax=Arthrobacter sp. OAP107 TaxID=3156445 RepID=UPI0033929F62